MSDRTTLVAAAEAGTQDLYVSKRYPKVERTTPSAPKPYNPLAIRGPIQWIDGLAKPAKRNKLTIMQPW